MRIFINYRSGDASFAAVYLEKVLGERFGAGNVFRDSNSIPLGVDFRPELWRSLTRSDVLLVVVGPNWLDAAKDGRRLLDNEQDYVRAEIAMAFTIGIRVIPVLVEGAALPGREQLPANIGDLHSRQYVRLGVRTSAGDTAYFLDQLSDILKHPPRDGHGDGAGPPPQPPAPAPAVPAVERVGFQFLGDVHADGSTWVAGDHHVHGPQQPNGVQA